jgi:hypothetical protein
MKTSKWDKIFDGCVVLLQDSADRIDPYVPGGMSYEKINVLSFCVVLPVVMGVSLGLNAYLFRKLLAKGRQLP